MYADTVIDYQDNQTATSKPAIGLEQRLDESVMMSKKPSVVKYTKAPQAPRRFKSSYMFFSTEKHQELRKDLAAKGENDKVSKTELP